jgi:hypothetical protein
MTHEEEMQRSMALMERVDSFLREQGLQPSQGAELYINIIERMLQGIEQLRAGKRIDSYWDRYNE